MNCFYCDEPVLDGEQHPNTGDPTHMECFERSVVGSAGHLLHRCSCYVKFGGAMEDPPNLSRREAARAAVAVNRQINQWIDEWFS